MHPDVQATFEKTVKLCAELGHTMIEKKALDANLRKLYKAQGFVSGAVAVVGYEEWAEKMQRPIDISTLEWLALVGYRAAKEMAPRDVAWGLQTIRLVGRQILGLYREFDVLLQPIQITPPPPLGFLDPMNVRAREFNRRQGQTFGMTPIANLTGQPAMSVPMGLSSDRLPLAMMFSGRYGDEATLFRLAAQIEQAHPWIDRKPPIWN
ncbi:MAG: amidase family protein [Rhizomicrobium sp.]